MFLSALQHASVNRLEQKKSQVGFFHLLWKKTPTNSGGMVWQLAWQIMRKGVQGEHWGSAAGVVSWVGGHCPRQGSSDMVSIWPEAVSSVGTIKDVATQTECPQKHTAIQVLGCKECQSLALLSEGSRENSCVRYNQVNNLLGPVAELREV